MNELQIIECGGDNLKEFCEWKIFDSSEYDLLKDFDFRSFSKKGYVYLLEYGKNLKIGTTKEPYKRTMSLKSIGRDYSQIETGKIAISPMHTNRKENERKFHELFSDKRIANGELFSISLENALKEIKKCNIEYKIIEEEKSDPKAIVRYFCGDRYHLPKRRTKGPKYICWEEEFEDRVFMLAINSGTTTDEIVKKVVESLESNPLFNDRKAEHEEELGHVPKYAMDIVSYFPELGRMADDILGLLEEAAEKKLREE